MVAARWKLRAPWIEDVSQIMSPVGYAGVDLYARHEGRWRWLSGRRVSEVRAIKAQRVSRILLRRRIIGMVG